MTFNQINYFLTVASCLNFTRAASTLFISQSALSRSISALEEELAVPLLVRDFHNVKLTPAGEIFYHEMGDIMGSINEVLKKVAAANDANNKFVIGILDGQSVDSKVLFGLKSLSDAFPNVSVELCRMRHSGLVEAIKKGNIDIAQTVISKDTLLDDELEKQVIKGESYFLFAREDSELWGKPVGLNMLDDETIIVRQDVSPDLTDVARIIDESCAVKRIRIAPDEGTRSLWLESGMGVTICSRNHVIFASNMRPVKAVELEGLGTALTTLVWSKAHNPELLGFFLRFINK